jgi:aspartyl-tRNA(Asn)/glutamyl-tRNA(Gln) amidotransferase subunit B
MEYEAVIGIEVHAQLITASKMFCGCRADYAASPPNTCVCPVCLGLPGALPTINRAAVEATIRTGLALDCHIPAFARFDRKNYPYPDLPKGYQVSQYDAPLCIGGGLSIGERERERLIRIRRVHLEEDTARLVHADGCSLIDYNRAGIPLMEIVTEADLRSADECFDYLARLRTTLRYLGVSTGDMEDGAMRCEVNISMRPGGTPDMGTKVEVKNLNSFRAVRQAVAYEIERQSKRLERGQAVEQVTMGWDEERRCTVFQRSKETSEDYRYFPDPDLPPLEHDEGWVAALKHTLPELPDAKVRRFVSDLHIRPADASQLAQSSRLSDYFQGAVEAAAGAVEPQVLANWVLVEVLRHLNALGRDIEHLGVSPSGLVALIRLVADGSINQGAAKDVLGEMINTGRTADDIVSSRNLAQISDEMAVRGVLRQVLADNPGPVAQLLEGKVAVRAFLIGQVMRLTRGQANAQVAACLLEDELASRRG